MGVSKTGNHIQLKNKLQISSQETQVFSTAKIRLWRTNLFFAPSKSIWSAKILNVGESKISYHIQMKIKMLNPSQEPSASSKAPNRNFKNMDVLCPFKFKIETQILDHGCIKDHCPYSKQDQDDKS